MTSALGRGGFEHLSLLLRRQGKVLSILPGPELIQAADSGSLSDVPSSA